MAFTDYSEPSIEEDKFTSKFNEAFLKMHRIHKLQDSIIQCSFNLRSYNDKTETYNYEIVLSCCNGVLFEVWGKLTKEEREEALKRKSAIETFLKKHPVQKQTTNQTTNKHDIKFNMNNWETFKENLDKYHFYMRELLSRTGYDSPNNEDDYDGL